MELKSALVLLFQFPVVLLLFLLIFRFVKTCQGSKPKCMNQKLPPGPWKLPIIGSLHHIGGSLPYRALRDLARKYGPLMHVQLGEVSAVVVSSPKLAKEVMRTYGHSFPCRPELFAPKIMTYGCTDIVFSPYNEYWRELRKICTLELLSTNRVQSFRWIREDEASNFVGWVASNAGSSVNLTQHLISLTFRIIARAAFGKECSDQARFVELAKEVVGLIGGFDIADIFPSWTFLHSICGTRAKLERMHREIDSILEKIIVEHLRAKTERSEASEDLIDVLLRIKEGVDGGFSLSTDNIKAVILDVFIGGGDTSAATIIWAMAEMVKNPRTLQNAQAEVRQVFTRLGEVREEGLTKLEYLKLVIKETLRLHHAVPLLPRVCRESCEINGFRIPVETRVMINGWAIGRDPDYWDEPEAFNPERFLNSSIDYKGNDSEYIPFGAGRRMCPGINFGLATVEHQLAMLLYHFDWKLPDGMKNEDLDMMESFGGLIKRKHDLHLIPTPYRPSVEN